MATKTKNGKRTRKVSFEIPDEYLNGKEFTIEIG